MSDTRRLFEARSYKVTEELSNTGRNVVYKLEKDRTSFIGKASLTKEAVLMENDIWWCLTMQRLTDETSPVCAPKVMEYGNGWMVQEFIDVPLLISKERPAESDFLPHIDRLVEVLAWMDKSLRLARVKPLYDSSETAPYFNLVEKVDGWVRRALEEGTLVEHDYVRARKLIEKYLPRVVPAFQHGDFVPWHMLDLKSKVCLFDGEHASLTKPRYYDVAYLYTRWFTRGKAPAAASRVLHGFITHIDVDEEEFLAAMLPVMTLRAFGMFNDAYNDRPTIDYMAEAQELLRRCLKEDLSAFIS